MHYYMTGRLFTKPLLKAKFFMTPMILHIPDFNARKSGNFRNKTKFRLFENSRAKTIFKSICAKILLLFTCKP